MFERLLTFIGCVATSILLNFRVWSDYRVSQDVCKITTQIRWVQKHWVGTTSPPWAIDDIYIGEACPDMCNGRGDCRNGHCVCDPGAYGKTCEPARDSLLQRLIDSFEGAIYMHYWESVRGGGIGIGCGALRPHAHGKSLYFNGCGQRHAVTQPLNLFTGGKIIFVLQIGCQAQTIDCNVNLKSPQYFRGVLLQYSDNKGVEWKLLARHEPRDYLNAKQVAYDIPRDLSKVGVQFRWWQPEHGGQGHDQWAIDNVEILAGFSTQRVILSGHNVALIASHARNIIEYGYSIRPADTEQKPDVQTVYKSAAEAGDDIKL